MTIENLEAKRAQSAWGAVQEVVKKDEKSRKEYRSLVRSTPALVLSSGLLQTLAFLKAKGEAHRALYSHLSGWVAPRLGADGKPLFEHLLSAGSDDHRLATRESIAYLSWLKRIAEATIEEPEEA